MNRKLPNGRIIFVTGPDSNKSVWNCIVCPVQYQCVRQNDVLESSVFAFSHDDYACLEWKSPSSERKNDTAFGFRQL